jgi:predicted nucleotidyltransferase
MQIFLFLTMQNLEGIKALILLNKNRLMDRYGLSSIGIFGSYARNEQREDSDLDLLVEFSEPIGLEFIDLADELERLLHIKVDLVSRSGVSSRYLPYIEKELLYV